jgi:hypothetical protein
VNSSLLDHYIVKYVTENSNMSLSAIAKFGGKTVSWTRNHPMDVSPQVVFMRTLIAHNPRQWQLVAILSLKFDA